MNNLCRALQRAQSLHWAFLSAPHTLLSLSTSPCSSNNNARQLSSSSSSDDVTATAPRSSSSKAHHEDPEQQQQQQHHAAPSAFDTSPDAFTAHLQSKTEADVFSLLENARAARLAEAAAAARAAGSGDTGSVGAAADAAAQAEEDAADDDTADMINPETGEVGRVCRWQDGNPSIALPACFCIYVARDGRVSGQDNCTCAAAALVTALSFLLKGHGTRPLHPRTLSAVSACTVFQLYGPRGKEPTRYGDWEIKGRATDFS